MIYLDITEAEVDCQAGKTNCQGGAKYMEKSTLKFKGNQSLVIHEENEELPKYSVLKQNIFSIFAWIKIRIGLRSLRTV